MPRHVDHAPRRPSSSQMYAQAPTWRCSITPPTHVARSSLHPPLAVVVERALRVDGAPTARRVTGAVDTLRCMELTLQVPTHPVRTTTSVLCQYSPCTRSHTRPRWRGWVPRVAFASQCMLPPSLLCTAQTIWSPETVCVSPASSHSSCPQSNGGDTR